MKLEEIELGELYVLNDGELYECIALWDDDPNYAYARMVKRSLGRGHFSDDVQPYFYKEGVLLQFTRKATVEDIVGIVDLYFEKIEQANEDLSYYCEQANGLSKKLVDRD